MTIDRLSRRILLKGTAGALAAGALGTPGPRPDGDAEISRRH